MANPLIDSTTLDVDGIKTSLKTFLQSQTEFSDYNFDGAGLNVMLNILSANTHYYALYKAMVANESFQNSAILRSSIIDRANEKGYLPGGVKASSSTLSLTLNNATPGQTSIPIPKGTIFQGTVNNGTYYFVSTDQNDLLPTLTSGQYSGSFVVREGQYVTTTFDYVLGGRFILPNSNVDPGSIRVRVQPSRQNTASISYFQINSIISVTGTSPVYFLTENELGNYELIFGNGIFGAALTQGNVIVVDYIVSTPGEGDGVTIFTPTAPIFNTGTLTIDSTPSSGSALVESIESIRENIKRYVPQQNRCVIDADYESEVRRQFPEYLDVSAWGGENNIPPVLGKTFICVLPSNLLPLTQQRKRQLISAIKLKNITAITPEIVDPVLTYIRLTASIKYNPNLTVNTPNGLLNLIRNSILTYNSTSLSKFACSFIESQLITKISEADSSIISNRIVIALENTILPDLLNIGSYSIQYTASIKPGTVTSEPFIMQNASINTTYRVGDKDGLIQLIGYPNDGSASYIVPGNWGTVNYSTGTISIGNLLIQPIINKLGWAVTAEPVDQDIFASGNQVIIINMNSLVINLQAIIQ